MRRRVVSLTAFVSYSRCSSRVCTPMSVRRRSRYGPTAPAGSADRAPPSPSASPWSRPASRWRRSWTTTEDAGFQVVELVEVEESGAGEGVAGAGLLTGGVLGFQGDAGTADDGGEAEVLDTRVRTTTPVVRVSTSGRSGSGSPLWVVSGIAPTVGCDQPGEALSDH